LNNAIVSCYREEMSRRSRLLTALALAAVTTGCNQLLGIKDLGGGGGDDGGIPDAPIEAFIVTETTPAANATAGDVENPVVVKFSHALDTSTVTTTTFTLVHRPDDAPVAVTPSVTGGAVTLTLPRPLDFLEPYRLTIAGGVTDVDGKQLGADVVVDFTARDGKWTVLPALAPVTAGDTIEGVSLASSAQAPFWIAWAERGPNERSNYVAHVSVAGALDTPAMLATTSGLDGYSLGVPQLVVGGPERAFAYWGQIDGGLSSAINSRNFDPGSGWSDVTQVSGAIKASPPAPTAGIDGDGSTYLVFASNNGETTTPASTRVRNPAGVWANGKTFVNEAYPFAVVGDSPGAGASVYYVNSTGIEYGRYFASDGTFHYSGTYYSTSGGATIPCAIAVQYEMVYLVAIGGSNAVHSGQLGTLSASDPSVGCPGGAVDGNGNLMVVWPQGAGVDAQVHARRNVSNVGLGPDTRLDDPAKGASTQPHIGLDAAGRGLALWAQTDGVKPTIRARRFFPGAGWTTAIDDVQIGTGTISSTQLVVEPTGRALALIVRSDGTSLALYH
jgi:hypothetical protein